MKKLWIKLITCVAALVFGTAILTGVGCSKKPERPTPPDEQPEVTQYVVGYLPDWSYSHYRNIDFSHLTHINISFCNPVGSQLKMGIPDSAMADIVQTAHAQGVKVMAALGGGGGSDPYRPLVTSPEKIASLNAMIESFCVKYDLDGVDLDIELGSGDSIWNYYGDWVTALREVCDEHEWQLSTATAQWVAEKVADETFEKFDFINVMAYDNDGRGTTSHASYSFAVDCLNYFETRHHIPKEKLILGVPFYGRGYKNGVLDWNSYRSFRDLVRDDVANYDRDVYQGVAYTGASTMRQKCQLAKDYGGVMIWEITLDCFDEYSLLTVIAEEILGR